MKTSTQCFPETYRGHFFGQYQLTTIPYTGEDHSKKCFIFSGQGAVKPGMLVDYYESSSIIQSRFEIADSLAKDHHLPAVSLYISQPKSIPKEQIIITRILCLLTLEIGIYEHLRSVNLKPTLLAGHSFGDLPLLYAAGVIDFKTLFKLVIHRERNSPAEHSLGYLMVAYCGEKALEDAGHSSDYSIANINSTKETAIAVLKENAKNVKADLKAKGIKTNILRSVPHPYHSAMMQPLSEAMAVGITEIAPSYSNPHTAFYSCTLNKLVTPDNFNSDDAIKIVTQNVLNPVNFVDLVQQIYRAGIKHFIEIGPSPVCSAFVSDSVSDQKIKSEFATQWIEKKKSKTRKLLDEKSNAILSSINKAIGKLTGYEIEQIAIEDKYQEELGIDSLKKVEIIVTVLEEYDITNSQGVSISDFETIEDTINYIKHTQAGSSSTQLIARKTCFQRMVPEWKQQTSEFIVSTSKSITSTYSKQLPILEVSAITNADGELFCQRFLAEHWQDNSDKSIVLRTEHIERNSNALKLDSFQLDLFNKPVSEALLPIWSFFQYLLTLHRDSEKSIYVSAVNKPNPIVSALFGYLKAASKEQPNLTIKLFEFDKPLSNSALLEHIESEQLSADEHIRWENQQRFVPHLIPAEKVQDSSLKSDAVVVAIGGAKGICFSLLKEIVTQKPLTLFVLGRSGADDGLIGKNISELKELSREMGSKTKIHYSQLDASQQSVLINYLAEICDQQGRIDLLINSAGIVKVSMLQDKHRADFDQEFFSKTAPAYHCLMAAKELPIEQTITFSSVLGQFGGSGQTIYCAANAMINAMVNCFNRQETEKNALSLCWPPWDNTGMTENKLVNKQLNDLGLSLLTTSNASDLFNSDLSGSRGNLYYFDNSDLGRYQPSSGVMSALAPLLGFSRSVDKRNIQHSYTFFKHYDIETIDRYLKDHRIANIPCVPAATLMMQAYALARLHFQHPVTLENFEIQNPLLVKSSIDSYCYADICEDISGKHTDTSYGVNKSQEQRLNITTESTLKHATSQACARALHWQNHIEFDTRFNPKLLSKHRTINLSKIYHNKSNAFNHIYHGESFKHLKEAYLDNNDNPAFVVSIDSIENLYPGQLMDSNALQASCSRLTLLIDNAFQALGIVLKYEHKLNTLPIAVQRFTLASNQDTDLIYISPLIRSYGDKHCVGDIALFDEQGELVALFEGVRMSQ